VPYEQVQSEEEGQIVQVLDGTELPPETVWHIVEEEWLAKWRRFVLGRDARRYAPPGPITNHNLFDADWTPASVLSGGEKKKKRPVRGGLVIARDYRVVNYNVWHFYQTVHGGGPVIGRKYDEIYSPNAFSRLQALILIQGRVRCYIAKKKLDKLYTAKFSSTLIAKKIMTQASESEMGMIVEKRIQECSRDRVQDKLEFAARLTQNLWRNKKRYIPEENLARRKRDQEVFARARVTKRVEGVTEDVKMGEGLVVTDVHPIVHIGNTGIYTRVLTEEDGIPFSLAREPGSEMAIIDKKTPEESSENFKIGSKLIAINYVPTAALKYEETKEKLKAATFPLHLELSYPSNDLYVKKLHQLDDRVTKQLQDPALRYRAFKLLMAIAPDKDGRSKNGIILRKHDYKSTGGFHESSMYISETELFYKRKRTENPWTGISLYSLKYIRRGGTRSKEGKDEAPALTARFAHKKGYDLAHFFELVTTERSYIFEVMPSTSTSTSTGVSSPYVSDSSTLNNNNNNNKKLSDMKLQRNFSRSIRDLFPFQNATATSTSPNVTYSKNKAYSMNLKSSSDEEDIYYQDDYIKTQTVEDKRLKETELLVEGLDMLIQESKGSQWYVSREGVPMRRGKAKQTLRKIV